MMLRFVSGNGDVYGSAGSLHSVILREEEAEVRLMDEGISLLLTVLLLFVFRRRLSNAFDFC